MNHDPALTVELLALRHRSDTLIAAAAARRAAKLTHEHRVEIPADEIDKAIEQYRSLLLKALGARPIGGRAK
jgi:hypothetical protein